MDKITKKQFIKKHAYQIGIEKDVAALIDSVKEECAKEMIQRIKSLFEPKTHGTGRTTIGERKGLKLAIKAIRDSKE